MQLDDLHNGIHKSLRFVPWSVAQVTTGDSTLGGVMRIMGPGI